MKRNMEALLNIITDDFLNYVKDEQTRENRRRIKASPNMKIENFRLTPDSQTPDSTDQEMSSREGTPSEDGWVTPKRRHNEGVDFTKCRRINFDLPENEEEGTDS